MDSTKVKHFPFIFQIQCQDQTLNNSNAAYESTVIFYDTDDKIIQVVKAERAYCKRGQAETIDVPLEVAGAGKTMVLLIKPVVNITSTTAKSN